MKNFFKTMLSSESNISSKRFNGTLLLLVFIIGTIYATIISKELTTSAITLLTTSAYLGAGMLLGTILERSK